MWLKEKMRYFIYGLPFIVLLISEGLVRLGSPDLDRSSVYVPVLAAFPFLYLVQSFVIANFGGNVVIALMLTSLVYLLASCLFLSYISWGMLCCLIILGCIIIFSVIKSKYLDK